MMQKIYLLVLLAVLQSCTNPATECASCNEEIMQHEMAGYEIINFVSDAIFDTVTVVIHGVISDTETKAAINDAEIIIGLDTAYTDQSGSYQFHHIPGGLSTMTIKSSQGRLTTIDSLDFGTGKSWILNIGITNGTDVE